jgi:hypothetical protein
MHFEKGLVDSSTEQIDEGHSTVAAFAHLIEELDEWIDLQILDNSFNSKLYILVDAVYT